MTKTIMRILSGALLFALLGCSTIEVSQDYDETQSFTALKTFAWQGRIQAKTGDIRVDSPLIDRRIRHAVEQVLLAKGITQRRDNRPDFRIQYTYTISQKLQSTPMSTGVGIGYGSRGSIGGFGISTGTDIREYDQGLLVIDFLDPTTKDLLWRGTSTRVVNIHATPDETTQDLQTTVETLLAQFPPE